MADFESAIEQAIENQDISGCVLNATNRDGSFTYSKSFGTDAAQNPLTNDSIMWIASCTKLLTAVSALQLVERGLISLDDPVYSHIPELKDFKIITGFDDQGAPITVPHKNPITLRNLLSHSSGIAYDAMYPLLGAWLKSQGKESSMAGRLLERFDVPLIFEPGTSWMYGPSIDFAGLLIERITKQTLEEYFAKNIWEPLGIKDMTFFLAKRPDLKERLSKMSKRSESGKVTTWDEPYHVGTGVEVEDCLGGQGLFAAPKEYIKVLHAVLTSDEDGKLLKKETVHQLFSGQLSEGGKSLMGMVLQDELARNAMGGIPTHIEKDYALGGLVVGRDLPDGRKEGTLIWGGLPNLMWFCDRKTGLTGLFATQLLPTGDAKAAVLNRKFEAGIIELYKNNGKGISGRL
ncbi:beta-lactamase/transpeptidase-like protein [Dendryphion nanum]|uniref:Beta-lactamase/transpeptidase-like protein n=1 Tax=Dendryphion nanum TaxID=256645 RepID=A0A9P9DP63_9PLEO|nr:beta-lactamase/transpeptidase-like protein [Dendryphion nanum]